MEITKVNITKYDDEYRINNHLSKNTLATVDIVIDYNIAVKGIQLMGGQKGEYLIFPEDNKGRTIAFPINEETRLNILNLVLKEYNLEG